MRIAAGNSFIPKLAKKAFLFGAHIPIIGISDSISRSSVDTRDKVDEQHTRTTFNRIAQAVTM